MSQTNGTPDTTRRVSVAGIVTGLGSVAVGLYALAGHPITPELLAAVALITGGVTGVLGSVGSLLAQRRSLAHTDTLAEGVQSLADQTALHVEDTDPLRARMIREAVVQVPGEGGA